MPGRKRMKIEEDIPGAGYLSQEQGIPGQDHNNNNNAVSSETGSGSVVEGERDSLYQGVYNRHECHPLSLSPNEMWRHFMESRADMNLEAAFASAAPHFRSLLPERQGLSPVWDVLWKRNGEQEMEENREHPPSYLFQPDPNLIRNWFQLIDSFLNRAPIPFPYQIEEGGYARHTGNFGQEGFCECEDEDCCRTQIHFCQNDPGKIEKFMKRLEALHYQDKNQTNPFIGREVVIYYENSDKFLGPLKTLLEKYGHYIWNLTLCAHFPQTAIFYRNTREILLLTKHLRVLELRYSGMYSHQERNQLEEEIQTRPLEQMTSLQYLSTFNVPEPILKELVLRTDHWAMPER